MSAPRPAAFDREGMDERPPKGASLGFGGAIARTSPRSAAWRSVAGSFGGRSSVRTTFGIPSGHRFAASEFDDSVAARFVVILQRTMGALCARSGDVRSSRQSRIDQTATRFIRRVRRTKANRA
jgi:hypothetical protein